MASNQPPNLLQCTGCHGPLNLYSKTLPCLHSFCRPCLDRHFEGQTKSQCPECKVSLILDQLKLEPYLVKCLRRLQLESSDWKCDWCAEDGKESIARNWCDDCQKLFCNSCCSYHNRHPVKHNIKDLDEIERGEVIQTILTDNCTLHQQSKTSYCEGCNMCFCDTCYQDHSGDSPVCSSLPLSVRRESSKQKSQGSTLDKEIVDLGISLTEQNEKVRGYRDKLNAECDFKCIKLWADYTEMWKTAKRRTNELCEEMRQITADQMKRWRHLIEGNEKILKQLEIWRLHLHHFLSECQQDVDVVCGLRSLRSKLLSRLQKPVEPEEKCQLVVTFPDRWLKVLQQLKTEMIGSVSFTRRETLSAAKNLVIHKEWNLCGSNPGIESIHVSKEDDHVFLCCYENRSIMEFTEGGEFVDECVLKDGTKRFFPHDMCSISPVIFVVVARDDDSWESKLIFLERKKLSPFLKIKNIIDIGKYFYSLCQINKTIFVCDFYLQVDSFTKEGRKIKTIKTRESEGLYSPRIRADPSTGNLWLTKTFYSSELFYINPKGEELPLEKIEETITDVCGEKLGNLYFCNKEGIFSFSPKRLLYKFKKRSEYPPSIFFLKNKIFVSYKIDRKESIKIFKMFY